MIQLSNLNFSYNKANRALTDVNATIGRGIYLLLGENGAGKTTLLHVIAGLLTPQSGSVDFDGLDTSLRTPEAMQRLMFVSDDFNPGFATIDSMVKCHAIFYPTFSHEVLADCLQSFGLTGLESLKALSLGNRKKSFLAYALALQVPLLMLDEPANGLDIDSKRILARLVAKYISPESTLIVSTHNVADLEYLFDGVIVMQRSHVLLCESVAEITSQLRFAVSDTEPVDVIYKQNDLGGWHSIGFASAEGESAPIDYTLLYNAVRSSAGNVILPLFKNK